MTAVEQGFQEHVKLLVKVGADPNGVSLEDLMGYAYHHLRVKKNDSDPETDGIFNHPRQRKTIKWEHRTPRIRGKYDRGVRELCMVPFWTTYAESDGYWYDFVDRPAVDDEYPADPREPMTSLMRAAQMGNIEVFNLLLDLGADASYWKYPSRWHGPITHSAAARSSPLHLAVQSKQASMIRHLLDLGFDPNVLPLVTPMSAVTPLMASVIEHGRFPEGYGLLSQDPRVDFNRRTPYCKVHIGHFAAASCSVEVLEDIMARTCFRLTGTTALGHTPLHLIYLPCGDVERLTTAKRDSLRDTRCMLLPYDDEGHEPGSRAGRQREMTQWLCERCPEALFRSDVYGNTPLHYQACISVSLNSLPKVFDGSEEVRELWETGINRFGWTPQDLNVYG